MQLNDAVKQFARECLMSLACSQFITVFNPGRGNGLYSYEHEIVFSENASFRVVLPTAFCNVSSIL